MDLIDRIKAEGRAEGEARGEARGEAKGLAKGKVLAFHEMGISLAEIARRVGITPAEVNSILAVL